LPLQNKWAERARGYLEPAEQIQTIFRAQSGLPPSWTGPILVLFLGLVFTANALSPGKITVLWVSMVVGAVVAVWIVGIVLVRFHHVVVTDRAIVVLDVNRVTNRPTRFRLRHSRDFHFGPMSKAWGKFVLDDTNYWVPRKFHSEVAAADAALTQ
jgi:hypothetical protein